jgi:Cof subfamily protein (haloacid dehalogenase superfamily)
MATRLVALDIDGTLLDSRGELPEENARAVAEAVGRGVKVILVTGRRWGMARKVSALLRLAFPLIVHNGALIKSPTDPRRLFARFIDQEVAVGILGVTQDYLRYAVLHRDVTADGQTVVHPLCLGNLMMQSYLCQFPDSVLQTVSLPEMIDAELIQIMFGGELEAMVNIETHLRNSGLLDRIKLTKTYYPEKNLGIVDVLHNHCSKGAALQFLAASYRIRREEVMAIGDNHNDLEMLEFAGTAVTVANCVEELKGRGFRETSSNNNCGVAEALRNYMK